MAADRKPAVRPSAEPADGRGERWWWPVALAILFRPVCTWRCPDSTGCSPDGWVPAVLLVLLAALIIGDPGRIDRQRPWLRIVANNATGLLATGRVIWARTINRQIDSYITRARLGRAA